MKVYVVTEQYNFDAPTVHKVFAKQEDAEKYCDSHEYDSNSTGEDLFYYWYEVEVE